MSVEIGPPSAEIGRRVGRWGRTGSPSTRAPFAANEAWRFSIRSQPGDFAALVAIGYAGARSDERRGILSRAIGWSRGTSWSRESFRCSSRPASR